MRNFLAALRRSSGTLIALTALVIVIASLIGRVQKLELDIKLLRSDLDRPRVQPLASILDARP
jgi:hypothetical protein